MRTTRNLSRHAPWWVAAAAPVVGVPVILAVLYLLT